MCLHGIYDVDPFLCYSVVANIYVIFVLQIFSLATDSPANCCCFVSENIVVTGTDDGTMYGVDLRNPRYPVEFTTSIFHFQNKRNRAA